MRFAASERVASVLRRSGVGVHPLEWRLPPIETYPWVVAFVQTWKGKLVLFALFAALMKPLHNVWFEMTAARNAWVRPIGLIRVGNHHHGRESAAATTWPAASSARVAAAISPVRTKM